jgi:hypothetical protein
MGKITKTAMIKARVSRQLKAALDAVVRARAESEAVIIREALTFYLSTLHKRHSGGVHPRSEGSGHAPRLKLVAAAILLCLSGLGS